MEKSPPEGFENRRYSATLGMTVLVSTGVLPL